jgi:hypothetical protein
MAAINNLVIKEGKHGPVLNTVTSDRIRNVDISEISLRDIQS